MDTPIALLVFNRPDVTAQVFARIAAQKPRTLLVVADGPRADRPGEAELCEQTRRIATAVDWDCRVLTNFSDTNLGCGLRVSSGLDWVFETVDRAIILEDDCLAGPDFFRFCEEMLDRYADDPRIGVISGNYHLSEDFRPPGSYFFSRYPFIWGWATWRRTWRHYDWRVARLAEAEREGVLDNLFDPPVAHYWKAIFRRIQADPHFTWDYQLSFALMAQGLLNIVPSVNLVSNIGFARPDATHTPHDSPLANRPCGTLPAELEHPAFVVANREADRQHARVVYGIVDNASEAAGVLLDLAVEQLGKGKDHEARVLLQHTLSRGSLTPEEAALAGVTAWRLGYAEAAFDLLAGAASQRPANWMISANLGLVARAMGRPAEARRALERAVALQEESAELHLNLAGVLTEIGDHAGALHHQRRGLELEPGNAAARQDLARMETAASLA
ncbi:tetratricopeptide repeat protein [Arenibaculum pallidiluteum]|uniref:tetratricopeptide repeat protein n=1 Tax=Arenibaculum pallidiluteum TaxID=2812559 RepID=UPI001A95B023|nr:tetratricopeptide repeat protein [Arenibaculum pallidiluteum]